MKKINAIDLFCGVGGLTNGLEKAKINVIAGYDIDPACEYPYNVNNKSTFIKKDVSSIDSIELECIKKSKNSIFTLLAGCAPCQPFSTYNNGKNTKKDKKWPLLYSFAKLIRESQPDLVTMENVPGVTKHKVYNDFVENLEKEGYSVTASTIYCPDFGIPQSRTRHVLMASRLGQILPLIETHKENEYLTVQDIIKDLPPIKSGEAHPDDPLHFCSNLSKINMNRIKHSKPGGTWRDWPKNLILDCHKKDSGKSFGSVYGRMLWSKPSPTMTTQCYGIGNGRFGHPEQNRAISLREAALFQTFPANYNFFPKEESPQISSLGRLIGNAVPVRLGEVIGKAFMKHTECL